jgi:hypothetical protein
MCTFKEWLWGPKSHWTVAKEKVKEKENKEKLIYIKPSVMCECGVQSNYGLVPSSLGIGHYLRPYG